MKPLFGPKTSEHRLNLKNYFEAWYYDINIYYCCVKLSAVLYRRYVVNQTSHLQCNLLFGFTYQRGESIRLSKFNPLCIIWHNYKLANYSFIKKMIIKWDTVIICQWAEMDLVNKQLVLQCIKHLFSSCFYWK